MQTEQFPPASRQVEYGEYRATIEQRGAVMTMNKRGGIGETERWEADGIVVAWMIVRYFKGEHDYEYYVSP